MARLSVVEVNMSVQTFLRFSGTLWENMEFEADTGYEVGIVPSHADIQGDGSYIVELLGPDGHSIVSFFPDVRFATGCEPDREGLSPAWVLAYLPFSPKATRLRFSRGTQVLFEQDIPVHAPRVQNIRLRRDGKRVAVSWSAKIPKGRKLRFQVWYVDDSEAEFLLAEELSRPTLKFALDELPGSKQARVRVVASDGVRSGEGLSKPFVVPNKAPVAQILCPLDGEQLPPDQPLTLMGNLSTISGESVPWGNIEWRIDGKKAGSAEQVASCPCPESGRHSVELLYTSTEGLKAKSKVWFKVASRSRSQERYFKLLKVYRGRREALQRSQSEERESPQRRAIPNQGSEVKP